MQYCEERSIVQSQKEDTLEVGECAFVCAMLLMQLMLKRAEMFPALTLANHWERQAWTTSHHELFPFLLFFHHISCLLFWSLVGRLVFLKRDGLLTASSSSEACRSMWILSARHPHDVWDQARFNLLLIMYCLLAVCIQRRRRSMFSFVNNNRQVKWCAVE